MKQTKNNNTMDIATNENNNKDVVLAVIFLLGIESIQVEDFKKQYPLYADYVINILKRNNTIALKDGKIVNIQKRNIEDLIINHIIGGRGKTFGVCKRGRPYGTPYKAFNFHCDVDIYEWLQKIKGDKGLTRTINDILRKEAGL